MNKVRHAVEGAQIAVCVSCACQPIACVCSVPSMVIPQGTHAGRVCSWRARVLASGALLPTYAHDPSPRPHLQLLPVSDCVSVACVRISFFASVVGVFLAGAHSRIAAKCICSATLHSNALMLRCTRQRMAG